MMAFIGGLHKGILLGFGGGVNDFVAGLNGLTGVSKGVGLTGGSLLEVPNIVRHPYEKDPKSDPNLENYPCVPPYTLCPQPYKLETSSAKLESLPGPPS